MPGPLSYTVGMGKQIRAYGSTSESNDLSEGAPPTAEEVERAHTNADTDTRAESQHHTLGSSPTQASPGDHRHDGGDSALLLEGQTITGSRATDAWRISVNALLVRLGAQDSSTP